MIDDVLLTKAGIIERCLERIKEEYIPSNFDKNFTKQDAVILNLLRAIEAAIDMANRIIRMRHLGLPQSTRDVFILLDQANIIEAELSQKLQAMVGFRNIAVHDYTHLNLEIIKSIIEKNLTDILVFSKHILTL